MSPSVSGLRVEGAKAGGGGGGGGEEEEEGREGVWGGCVSIIIRESSVTPEPHIAGSLH